MLFLLPKKNCFHKLIQVEKAIEPKEKKGSRVFANIFGGIHQTFKEMMIQTDHR